MAAAAFAVAPAAGSLVFSAHPQPCGSPRLEVPADGKVVHGRMVAGSGSYAVPGSWAAAQHSLTFAYLNEPGSVRQTTGT